MLGSALAVAWPASAAWVSVCESSSHGQTQGGYRVNFETTGSATDVLITRDIPVGCASVEIDVPAEAVRWAGLVEPSVAERARFGIALQGIPAEKRFRVAEILPITTPPQPDPPLTFSLPLDRELLPSYETIPFGVEERAQIASTPQGLALICTAGTQPAGTVLRGRRSRLPQGAPIALSVEYAATGSFEVGISDAGRTARGSPILLGELPAQNLNRSRELAVPEDPTMERNGRIAWSFLCPQETARMDVRSLKLVSTSRQARTPGRAAWAWEPRLWRDAPGELLDRLYRSGAETVFITIPISEDDSRVIETERLRAFVRQARGRGVEVWAVEGDPHAVLLDERPKFVRRARALCDYNRLASIDARLRGVQYDIEPYLILGYHLATEHWLQAYLETVAELRAAAGMPVDLAVPFWWAEQRTAGGRLLEQLALFADTLTVMNYRTDADLIRHSAEPYLAWGSRFGKKVRIALEAGPLPDEAREHYYKADAGQLWLLPMGARPVLILHNTNQPNPFGLAYAFSHTTLVPGSRLSFHKESSKLIALLPALEREWTAWPAFAGVALHEFTPP